MMEENKMAKKATGTKKSGSSKERMTQGGVFRPVNINDIQWANKPTGSKGRKKK